MKFLVAFIAVLFWSTSAFAQAEWYSDVILIHKGMAVQKFAEESFILREKEKEDSVLGEEKAYIREDALREAALYYQELADSFPASKLLLSALERKGDIEMKLKNFEDATQTYQRLLDLCKTDTIRIKRKLQNVQYYAYTALATIAIDEGTYKQAIVDLDKASKHLYACNCRTCGGLSPYESVRLARLYTDAYLGMQDFKTAYSYLLPAFFSYTTISNKEFINYTYSVLLEKYNATEIKKSYETAFTDLCVEPYEEDSARSTIYIKFLENEIPIYNIYTPKNKSIQTVMKEYYLKSPLYSVLPKD